MPIIIVKNRLSLDTNFIHTLQDYIKSVIVDVSSIPINELEMFLSLTWHLPFKTYHMLIMMQKFYENQESGCLRQRTYGQSYLLASNNMIARKDAKQI